LKAKQTTSAMGLFLGRRRSTIGRELSRAHGQRGDLVKQACAKASE
jgi:IS30 family transposase